MQSIPPSIRAAELALVSMPGAMLDVVVETSAPDRAVMAALQAYAAALGGTTSELVVRTNRGDLRAILTLCQNQPSGVLWLGPAGPALNGPAGGIFADLAHTLNRLGISSLRLDYRDRTSFEECLLDALISLALLKASGMSEVVIVGHQLGGAVAIAAAALVPWVKGVAAIAARPQAMGFVARIAPRPLLVLHGGQDTQSPLSVSEELYAGAREPKELIIYPEAGFRLLEARDAILAKVGGWAADCLGKGVEYALLQEASAISDEVVRDLPGDDDAPARRIVLTRASLPVLAADALVSPTGVWLDLNNTPLARELVRRGGESIQAELLAQAPLMMGEVGVTRAGQLQARYVFHVITGGDAEEQGMSSEEMVAQSTYNALEAARDRGLRSIAFPALAAGNRGFPPEKVARIMTALIAQHLTQPTSLEQVTLSMVTEGTFQAFADQLNALS